MNGATGKSKFAIPEEFQQKLRYRQCQDQRTDEEIFRSLNRHIPVTDSEKNIWAFWHAGIARMPPWCQRNVIAWVRLNPGWTVRVLDSVKESPNYALNYVPAEWVPKTFIEGTMDGTHRGQHSSDFLRGPCLYLYGGVYQDVGNIPIRSLDRICWKQLEDPQSQYKVSAPWMMGEICANHFQAARKGDPFIKRWHDLFVHLWKDRTNADGVFMDPLLVPTQDQMNFDAARASRFDFDFNIGQVEFMSYVGQIACWNRLCMLEDAGDGFSCVDYWMNNVLAFDVLQEDWAGEEILGFAGFGQKMFDIMTTCLDADPQSEEYQRAYKVIWRLLTESAMQKVTRGKGMTAQPMLGVLLEEPGNEDKDHIPGTFGELLRYGALNFEQTREQIRYVQPRMPPKTLKKGVLEP